MEDIKYVCQECGYEAEVTCLCPDCQVMLVASCTACGNPVVGDIIQAED